MTIYEQEYQLALKKLEVIFDGEAGKQGGNQLAKLAILIDEYEKLHFPIELPNPDETVKFRSDQLGLI